MLNHVEIQGKISGGTLTSETATMFFILHKRGFGDELDRFPCVVEGDRRRLLDGAKEGRTVIVTGHLRTTASSRVGTCEIVCETIDFVDGGGGNGS